MTSPTLRLLIAKTREHAPHELPKARLCANVILAVIEGEDAAQWAIAQLKQSLGNKWSHITAFQFMSGRRGEFAADCAAPEEQGQLHLACLIAKQVCNQIVLGAGRSPQWGIDVAKLRALAFAVNPTIDEAAGMAWWNSLSEPIRAEWAAKAGTGVVADAWTAYKGANMKRLQQSSSEKKIEVAQAEAMKIMTEAKALLEQTGLEVSLIVRCPNGSKWPVLMLEVGENYSDIEKVRNGER